ncbi:MAG: hypothetical protein JXL80_14690 [Planctomycetes bacterium]|nr:hypothetical protein [Planctomycetota bacterium]
MGRVLRCGVGSVVAALSLAAVAGWATAATVVVAPLHDASAAADSDTVQGVTDLLAGVLAERVTVVDREKLAVLLAEQGLSASALNEQETAVRVGGLLKADFLLTGSVFRKADEISFAVQLVRISTGEVVKGVTISGSPGDLLKLGRDLAAQCVEALQGGGRESVRDEQPGATHLAEEQFFLEALGYYHAGNFDLAIMNCLKVIQLNPNNVRARLRLAESFLAGDEADQARIALHRTLELFPRTELSPRIAALMDRLDPVSLQAVENQSLVVPLPVGWPADATVGYELSWQGQPARRDSTKAAEGRLTVTMPGARVPLDLQMALSTDGQPTAKVFVRLWPSDAGIRQGETKLVIVDPKDEFSPLVKGIEFKRYQSCQSTPESGTRMVVAPAAVAKITIDQAKALTAFVEAGGQLAMIGSAAPGIELTGIRTAEAWWPAIRSWHGESDAAAWSFMPLGDFVSVMSRVQQAALLTGGAPWLYTGDKSVAMISHKDVGKGRLLWIAWPVAWDPADPRAARAVALAISDAAFQNLKPQVDTAGE